MKYVRYLVCIVISFPTYSMQKLSRVQKYHKRIIVFLEAARKGNNNLLERLLELSIPINSRNREGDTALIVAASKGWIETISFLIEKGADIHAINKEGWTPLLAAASAGHTEAVRYLIEKGASIKCSCTFGNTPLLFAAHKGHRALIELLLAKGAYIEETNKQKYTALLAAAEGGHNDCVALLLDRDAYIEARNYQKETPLLVAANGGYEEIVRVLLDRGADINAQNKDGDTALIRAAHKRYPKVVKLLLVRGADIEAKNCYGTPALTAAAAQGCEKSVELLVKNGANINVRNKDGTTPLVIAAVQRHREIVELLLEKGAELPIANHTDMKEVIDAGWDFVKEDLGTFMAVLIKRKLNEVIIPLIKKGLNIKKKYELIEYGGQTMLIMAARFDNLMLANYLISAGVDNNHRDDDGKTALMYAAAQGNIPLVSLLIENDKKIDVTLQAYDGHTALTLATQGGHTEVVEKLIATGAYCGLASLLGSALKVAVRYKYFDIAKMLLAAGAVDKCSSLISMLEEQYPQFNLRVKKCATCGASGEKLKVCGACKLIPYCSVECQTRDWKTRHKIVCRSLK